MSPVIDTVFDGDICLPLQVVTHIGVISKSQLSNPNHYALTFRSSSASLASNSAIFSITGSFASSESSLLSTASNREIVTFSRLSLLKLLFLHFIQFRHEQPFYPAWYFTYFLHDEMFLAKLSSSLQYQPEFYHGRFLPFEVGNLNF